MILRALGRRGTTTSQENKLKNGVSNSTSQEFTEDDVYDFSFQSQDSTVCNWSNPYSFYSSQGSTKSSFYGGGLRKSKKMKILENDSGSNSSQESEKLGVLEISDVGFQKSKKFKKVDFFDPYEYNSSPERGDGFKEVKGRIRNGSSQNLGSNSSQESEKFGVLEISDEGFQKSKKFKKVDFSDPYEYNSSPERGDGFKEVKERIRNGSSRRKYVPPERKDRKSKKSKNVEFFDSCGSNPSRQSGDLGIPRGFGGVFGKRMKKEGVENGVLHNKMKKKMIESEESEPDYVEVTLMENEEVNLALDGLKKGQPVRTRRESLLSLLSICETVQQRQLLRVEGMAKTIIDAVLGLSLDDPPSNLAAAALFYIMTSDGQDDHLLNSPSCIRFLIKLLKPHSSGAAKEKALPIGSKLLSLCKNAGFLHESAAKGTDSSSTAIRLKVREILVNCKEMNPRDDTDDGMDDPELSPEWISLVAMEKACSSTISDTPGTLQKTRNNFKEKLRQFGGLDTVFEVARKCHSMMEEWLERSPTSALDLKDILGLKSLVLLLKCLKITENATFLSNDNQRHLLGMKGKFDGLRAPRSFTKLILAVINILSGVSLHRSTLEGTSQKSFKSRLESSQVSADQMLLELRVESSQAGLCSGTSRNSNSNACISADYSEMEFDVGKGQPIMKSEDPFAFCDDFEPPKWDLLSGSENKSLTEAVRATVSGYNGTHTLLVSSQQESNHIDSQGTSCSSSTSIDEDKYNLVADCLLTAVKVLMNLTNDNSEGCQQIAINGGLEILSSVIASHFPSFSLSSKKSRSNTPLTDQELDFLVALLGLLVNLVEKDGRNRSRLAAVSISLPNQEGLHSKEQSDMISLLCSIFLANQSEAAGEERYLAWEDEDSILQEAKEAEKMIVEAYAALLLAFLSTESKSTRNTIAELLPNHNLTILVPVLERFVEFHLTLNVISLETHSAVVEVIESCRIP